ncbi:hypothetical protein [Nocardia sp. NPDC046763]|uniref:hypothetical protein n=1 Tax=Nocardia sp. NPDC046763 TaxID=3155256 RepID=UPI0033DA3C78
MADDIYVNQPLLAAATSDIESIVAKMTNTANNLETLKGRLIASGFDGDGAVEYAKRMNSFDGDSKNLQTQLGTLNGKIEAAYKALTHQDYVSGQAFAGGRRA